MQAITIPKSAILASIVIGTCAILVSIAISTLGLDEYSNSTLKIVTTTVISILVVISSFGTSKKGNGCDACHSYAKCKRERLPSLIILVRHGESEGNADHTLYRTKADNLVELTSKGREQSTEAGKKIEMLLQTEERSNTKMKTNTKQRIHLMRSPFERTKQTSILIQKAIDHRVVRTEVEPRISEQEFGNLQGEDFKTFREEQTRIGRFWYRFPTGESGADVYDRVKSWWYQSVLNVNERYGCFENDEDDDQVEALVVVTHGLTMRFVLMQLLDWTPTTFHSVWNADNCHFYVLKKDLRLKGNSPYRLDGRGDLPKSSRDVIVTVRSTNSLNDADRSNTSYGSNSTESNTIQKKVV